MDPEIISRYNRSVIILSLLYIIVTSDRPHRVDAQISRQCSLEDGLRSSRDSRITKIPRLLWQNLGNRPRLVISIYKCVLISDML